VAAAEEKGQNALSPQRPALERSRAIAAALGQSGQSPCFRGLSRFRATPIEGTMGFMIGELFLRHSTNKLTQMTGYVEACLLTLDGDRIWSRGGGAQNSIGNLVLHLCGNVRQWIGSSIGGEPDVREREKEFDPASRMETAELLARLNRTVGDAVGVLENFPAERLGEMVRTQDGERSALEVIYQVVGHFQQHSGQIIFATKLATGEDLKFYKKSS
jgi:hypothetical protein